MLKKSLKVLVLLLLAYLLQTTVAPAIPIFGVAPNLALAVMAVVSVAMGRKYTFLISVSVGYLMELTLPAVKYISMALYPVSAMLAALFFSDKSERKLEEERTNAKFDKQQGQINPHIRTPLAAAVSCILYEGVHIMYVYLNGVPIGPNNLFPAIFDVLYTTALTAVLQFPLRWFIGVYKLKKRRA